MCRNQYCVSTECDETNHTDSPGSAWQQARGEVYCPVHDACHSDEVSCPYTDALSVMAENARCRRFRESGMTPEEFTAAEARGEF